MSSQHDHPMNVALRGDRHAAPAPNAETAGESTIVDSDTLDELATIAARLGVEHVDDLRRLLGGRANLNGAALQSAIRSEIVSRAWLAPNFDPTAAVTVNPPIDAGAHGDHGGPTADGDMNERIRTARGPQTNRGW